MNWFRFMRWAVQLMLLALCSTGIIAQTDSLPLTLAQLDWQDLQGNPFVDFSRQVSSASRSLRPVSELPFSIYVISADEIRRNGYITLTDALKMLPGVRISPAGSGLEGELFMMRGLLGNAYAKILIDGVPVKPFMVNGMPLGAQLPIQQAERIEVMYGPAAALYGADATNGVINIVTKSSERPVFTDAGLHLGAEEYSSMHVLFGGKMGEGNDVMRFKIFGSNTRFTDRRTVYDQETLYNPLEYTHILPNRADEIEESPNFKGVSASSPVLNELPHLSRSLGGELKYRFLQLSYINLQRQDHSALGLNPLAISYANPLNFTGETIQEGHLTARTALGEVDMQTTVSMLRYELDPRSSNTYIIPVLEGVLDLFADESPEPGVATAQVHNSFFNRSRFMRNSSTEYFLEHTARFHWLPGDEWTVGVKYQLGDGRPFLDFQPNPVRREEYEAENLKAVFSDPAYEELSAFAQWFYRAQHWTILVGGQYLNRSNSDFTERIRSFNPRLAVLYSPTDKLSWRASYSTAFKVPSPFLSASSYTIRESNFSDLLTGIVPLRAENTFSVELGLRWQPSEQLDWDVAAFYTKTRDFLTYDLVVNPRVNQRNLTIGYFNNENTNARLFGILSLLTIRNLAPAMGINGQLAVQISTGEETFLPIEQSGPDPIDDHVGSIQSLRAYPNIMAQARLQFRPLDRWLITLDHLYMGGSMPRNVLEIERRLSRGETESAIRQDDYYTLDITSSFRLSPNLDLYGKFMNLLNAKYAGIDANDGPDVLTYNPQSLFNFRIGVNYHLQ